MGFNRQNVLQYLNIGNFHMLLIEELGWDLSTEQAHVISIDQQLYTLHPLAQKRHITTYLCGPTSAGNLPDKITRSKIAKTVSSFAHEHIIIYTTASKDQQIWQALQREFAFYKGLSNDLLLEKLRVIATDISEENALGTTRVALKVRQAFDVEHITQKFYAKFQIEHAAFLDFIDGITTLVDKEWYASLMLNRLMFVYFIQKKGFLDNNLNYLPDKLQMMKERVGQGQFFSFYRHFLLRLFHDGLGKQKQQRSHELDTLLGDVPFLNGGLFEVHELEQGYTAIHIPDAAFERIFTFFDAYQWHIDEQPLQHDGEINPDVLGHIFEKYINQKQMGAYYTKEDITAYMSKHTIIPWIFQAAQQKYAAAFQKEAPLWQQLRTHPERYITETICTAQHLPTETEREYQTRRTRYSQLMTRIAAGEVASLNDFISYNLDSQLFLQDSIEACTDTKLLRAFYESIAHITILDPTCGSGAFLFAALNILQPLYTCCLQRMQSIVIAADGQNDTPTAITDIQLFREILQSVQKHVSPAYFILKAIAINNLYGVDIMKEAVEICKLRLFLKLAAQLKHVREIEPLPDIDFNIRPGNTLVGFARYGEIRKTILGEQQQKIDFAQAMEAIEHAAQEVEHACTYFRELQTLLPADRPDDYKEQKQAQRAKLQALCTQLDGYLASEYGIDRQHLPTEQSYQQAFQTWRSGHQPLHWFLEFYGIMQRGGFDVVIGNPPYIEYSKIRQAYKVQGYETESCGNLYAAVIERALQLCRSGESYLGLIVPLSICGGERFAQLRTTIRHNTSHLWLANFEIFPCRLFDGAFQRLSILLARHAHTQHPSLSLHVTKLQRWYATERPHLIDLITYTAAQNQVKPQVFPMLAAAHQDSILQKIAVKAAHDSIAKALYPRVTAHFIYYQEATNYWIKATCRIPFYSKNGVVMEPQHGRFLYFQDADTAHTVMAILNSSLFYVWFATYADGFHLSHGLVKNFPLTRDLYTVDALAQLALRLESDIQVHARRSTRNKAGLSIELEEYRMLYSKPLLDEIDGVLARYYDFTSAEFDFIINYDSKYRMGREGNNDQNG